MAGVALAAGGAGALVKRALVIGGAGRLGTAIARVWKDYAIVAPPRAELALEDAAAFDAALAAHVPDVVVNCAAFADVDGCETRAERAFALNALAVERAARASAGAGATFVTISTDYVFDGRARRPYGEDDAAAPLNVYGISKLAGELLVERLESQALIVRTCGLYGQPRPAGTGGDFVGRLVSRAQQGERVAVVSDAIVSPTFAEHVAAAIAALLGAGARGLYHAAAAEPVTWYDFAAELLARAGIGARLEPIRLRDWKAAARRPLYSALDSAKLGAAGFAMPTWREGIAEYLRAYPAFSLERPGIEPVR